ncbi:hypothetical protein V8953_09075 [Klebsiella michiganensis]|uniref:hypothetical protein n=1 Tax=Klebsiella michiganensis TaxID=1134687 RepID=UPI0030D0AABB
MTDITELAQSLKRRAASANEFGESLYVKADDILALVEALEKAQHEARVDWEAAASLNVENQELKRRIAELKSRTVKLPRPGFITISGERMAVYLKDDVDAAMLAAGIEEAE